MAYNETRFQLKMMLSSEFPHTKFLLLIDHLQKPEKFDTAKIFSYKVVETVISVVLVVVIAETLAGVVMLVIFKLNNIMPLF